MLCDPISVWFGLDQVLSDMEHADEHLLDGAAPKWLP